ncbi:MAG: aminopeptidase, partial [Muribaculaceae bacterium]|nr:aminopeptidase [Muribaculaceae bacterium]
MKKLIMSLAIGALTVPVAMATYMEAPAMEDDGVVVPDSTGFKFTDVKILPTTPVKDQNKSGTCWAFSGTSALEDEVLRQGGPELDLSEMYCVRNCYIDKAKKYIRTGGKINFAQGGGFNDVLYSLNNYGTMPEEAYTGLNYGEDKHSHYEMANALEAYLNVILTNPNKRLSTAWLPGFIGILDAYLGKVPETFTVDGKTYTPQEYAKAIGLDG